MKERVFKTLVICAVFILILTGCVMTGSGTGGQLLKTISCFVAQPEFLIRPVFPLSGPVAVNNTNQFITHGYYSRSAHRGGSDDILQYAGSIEFKFAVIGDTRPPFNSDSYANFENQIRLLNSVKPDFIINVGDLIYGYGSVDTEKPWKKYMNTISGIQAPYYQLPGNHDIFSKKGEAVYTTKFRQLYYSFDFKNSHFILMDSSENAVWGYISENQMSWLKEDLKKNKQRNIFVFTHFPLWDTKRSQADVKYQAVWRNEIMPLFNTYHIKAVFAGHVHSYGPTEEIDHIKYFITGGGGAELNKYYMEYGGQHHFMLVTVKDDKFDYRIITEKGVLTDEQADVTRNQIFAEKYSEHAVISFEKLQGQLEEEFTISVTNPYDSDMTGTAVLENVSDTFTLEPSKTDIIVKPGTKKEINFRLKVNNERFYTSQFPKIKFRLKVHDQDIIFMREVVLKRHITIKRSSKKIKIDGSLSEWEGDPQVILTEVNGDQPFARIRITYDNDNLYIGAVIGDKEDFIKNDHSMIFLNDALIVSIDRLFRQLSNENPDLQLEFSRFNSGIIVYNRARNERIDVEKTGIKVQIVREKADSVIYEIALPGLFLKPLTFTKGVRFGINVAVNNMNANNERKIIEWSPGIGLIGIDDSFQSQLHFAEAMFE